MFMVNRESLFSYHAASEKFLNKLMGLFVASHYKNTPNDLILLSDAPGHFVFVLLAPTNGANGAKNNSSAEKDSAAGEKDSAESEQTPDILCAVHLAAEG